MSSLRAIPIWRSAACLALALSLACPAAAFAADAAAEKPLIEIKILRQTDLYFDLDIGLDMPIRIRRADIVYLAKHLPPGIGRLFTAKTSSGTPIEILVNDEEIEKLKTARLTIPPEGIELDGLVFGKIIFRDMTPPPENIHLLPDQQVRLNDALLAAVQEGRTFDVAGLLGQGANPDSRRGMKYNAAPSHRMMIDLANRGVNEGNPATANEINDLMNQQVAAEQETALLYAARENYTDIAGMLLEAGADPNAYTYGGTAMGEAVRYRHLEMVKLLLKNKAATEWKRNPLMEKPEHSALSALISMPFAWKGTNAEIEAAQEQDLDIAYELLRHDADVNVQDENQFTPLQRLCAQGPSLKYLPELVNLLIKSGADVNRPGWRGDTALHWCLGSSRSVQLLLDAGADVHVKNGQGKTFATMTAEHLTTLNLGHVAHSADYVKSLKLVLDAGALQDATPEEAKTIAELLPRALPSAAASGLTPISAPRVEPSGELVHAKELPLATFSKEALSGKAMNGLNLHAKFNDYGGGPVGAVSLQNVGKHPIIIDLHGQWLVVDPTRPDDLEVHPSPGPLKKDQFVRLEPGTEDAITLSFDGISYADGFRLGYQSRATSPAAAEWLKKTFGKDAGLVWRGTVFSDPIQVGHGRKTRQPAKTTKQKSRSQE